MRSATIKAPGRSPSVLPQARPFLKWAGGKTQLLPDLFARFPHTFKRYHEPFLGGGAVFFALAPKSAILSDVNGDLVETYTAIRDDVEGVIAKLRAHTVSEEHYYRVRAQKSAALTPAAAAARTIYLNRTCFNGLYRVNRDGQFNVPFGKYDNPTICNEENLLAVSAALQDVQLRNESVFDIGARVRRGDLVYFDPPYDPLSPTSSFTSYAKTAFGRDEQKRLAELFTRLACRGVHVVLSNSDTPFIRAISARADRRGSVGEVIVSVG